MWSQAFKLPRVSSCCIAKSKRGKTLLLAVKCCLTLHLPHEINLNTTLMKLGNFIDVFLARRVSGTYVHHQER
jgi:hypothetical protein